MLTLRRYHLLLVLDAEHKDALAKLLAVQGLTPQLHIHRCVDFKLLQTISWTTQAGFAALAISFNGKWLAAVEQEQHCRLAVWDLQEVCFHSFDILLYTTSQCCTSSDCAKFLTWLAIAAHCLGSSVVQMITEKLQ